ncbi:MAG: ATP-binding cassette domain-containing protein [Prevotella sp.]|nr:ATP-binding cassette domain-containing protein [Prevotella sp.]
MNNGLYTIEHLRCSYDHQYVDGRSRVVLEISHLELPQGAKIFIVGESGIGKSTILETLGMMNNTIVPDASTRFIFHSGDGEDIDLKALWSCGDKELSRFRLENYSFIFQSTNLMRNFTAYENVAFTRMLQGYSRSESFARTKRVLEDLGLDHIDEQRMTQELSGGQQQRLAFARAILPDFTVLFGDEPTGNLDPENARRVMQILANKLDEATSSEGGAGQRASAIIVSHDMSLATSFADIIIKIRKATRPRQHADDEEISYGVIDEASVFRPTDEERSHWSNGKEQLERTYFEEYLRKK